MPHLTPDQIKKINKPALAQKHNCTDSYVRLVLNAKRKDYSDKAKAILADAEKMIQILES